MAQTFRTTLTVLLTLLLALSILLIAARPSLAKLWRIGEILCKEKGYTCVAVKKGDTWESLWADETQRHIVMRLNRLNLRLRKGMILAVPTKFDKQTDNKISPFPKSIGTPEEKIILVDLTQLAWGAYNIKGKLMRWGPASGGKSWCPDLKRGCRTPSREFNIKRKLNRRCKSHKYPLPDGGAPMPYCMFFHGGYAIHGSRQVPGYNASHGCIRMFVEDAKWLNESFVDLPSVEAESQGTKVIIMPYTNLRPKVSRKE